MSAPGGAHFIEEFSGSTGIEFAAEQLTDFGRLGLELLDQTADVIAVARQLRFEIVDWAGQNSLDDAGVDRFHAHLKPGIEAPHQCWPICSGVLSLAASAVAASAVKVSSGSTVSLSEVRNTQSM